MSDFLEKRKKLNKFWLWWNLIEGLVVLAAGVLAIFAGVRNDSSAANIDKVLGYAISIFVVLDGIFRVVMYFVKYEKGVDSTPLLIAGFEIALGALLIYIQVKYSGLLIEALIAFVAIALMVVGALMLTNAIFQITRLHEKLVMPIATIILDAILIGVGVAVLILSSSQDYHNTVTMIMTGAILSIIGLSLVIFAIFTAKKDKKQIEKYEAEEEGDFDVAGTKKGKGKKGKKDPIVAAEPADVIQEAEVIEPENHEVLSHEGNPDQISGPRAIENKDE